MTKQPGKALRKTSVAYFSMEIGLRSDIPTYSGGLGILAGDTIRAAADLKVPMVAVTLLPASLIFLLLILNDRAFMGEHVNTRRQNVANWGIVIFVIAVSSLMGISTLFPGLFQ